MKSKILHFFHIMYCGGIVKIDYYQDRIIVYLINKKVQLNINSIKEILIDVFNVLKNYYNIKLENSYHINFYINYYYGIIVELIKLDEVDNDIINIKLNILDDKLFLYEVDDPLDFLGNEIYYYDNKYYLNVKNVDIRLLEESKVIFDDNVYKILGRGVKI